MTVHKSGYVIDGMNGFERNVKRVLDKEKRRLMASVMSEPEFSWTSEKSLLKLLKYIQ